MPRISRRHSACGWPTGSRIWASASSASGTISRSPGFRADVLERFSRRTELIEQIAEEKGITNPDRKAELGAETREKKGKTLSLPELQKEWDTRLTTRNEQDWLAEVHRRESKPTRPEPGER